MKNTAVSSSKHLSTFLYVFFLIFTFGVITAQGGTHTVTITGTANVRTSSGLTPLPGTTVILKLGSGYPIYSNEYRALITDANGRYSTVKTFDCDPGSHEITPIIPTSDGSQSGG